MRDKIFYVYLHRRATDGSVFYVGKGHGSRHNSLSGRNTHWKNVAKKNGWRSEIFRDGMTECCAFTLEKILIHLGKGKLTNRATGGEGAAGVIHTDETKAKFRAAKLGKKQSPEHAAKSRVAGLGKKRPESAIRITAQARSKKVISSDGVIYDSVSSAVKALSEALGTRCSQGNISTCAIGKRNNAYGLSWSYDISKIPEFIPTSHNEKSIRCVETGSVFNSVTEAVSWVCAARGSARNQCISYAARRGKTAYGYRWEYIDNGPVDELKEVA